jgi:hypothetical protein
MTVKAAYAASVVIRSTAVGVSLLAGAIAAVMLWLWWSGAPVPVVTAVSLIFSSPLTWLVAVLGFAVALRRISFRLEDRDYD